MILLWKIFWPAVAIALLIGGASGVVMWRQLRLRAERGVGGRETVIRHLRRSRRIALVVGLAAALGTAALWAGPGGGAVRLAGEIEELSRRTLIHYEMGQVRASVERRPMVRRLILAGPADSFQRAELVRILNEVPGVSSVRWVNTAPRGTLLPLMVEVMLMALAGFSLGLLVAYLLELRRRARRWDRI